MLILGLILVLTSSVFAGGGSSGSSASGGTTLTFLGYSPILDDIQPDLERGFNRTHPGVKLNLIENPELLTLMATMISSGEPLDGFLLNHNNMMAQADLNNLVPLQSHFNPALYPKWYSDYYTYKGNTYAIPGMVAEAMGVYYNKKIFADNGIALPRTHADTEAVMDALLAKGITPFAMSGKTGLPNAIMLNIIIAIYEPVWNDAFPFDAKINDPRFIRCLDIFQRWRDKGYFGKDYDAYDNDGAIMNFMQGGAAMHVAMTNVAKSLAGNPDIDVLFFKRADGKDAGATSPAQHTSRGVFAKSKNLDLAIDYVKYFATEEPQKLIVDLTGGCPLNYPVNNGVTWNVPALYKAFGSANSEVFTFQNMRGFAFLDNGPNFWALFQDLMLQLLLKETTPQRWVVDADAALDYSKAVRR